GYETFGISRVTPDQRHRDFDLDTYISAIIEGLDAVEAITGTDRTHFLGVCAGGQLAAIALAHLAAVGDGDRAASLSVCVCVMDHADQAAPQSPLSPAAAELAAPC